MMETFEKIFGNTVELRMMEFFLPLQDIQFSIEEISEHIKASRRATFLAAMKFEKWGILVSGDGGYSINMESPLVRATIGLNNAIISEMIERGML